MTRWGCLTRRFPTTRPTGRNASRRCFESSAANCRPDRQPASPAPDCSRLRPPQGALASIGFRMEAMAGHTGRLGTSDGPFGCVAAAANLNLRYHHRAAVLGVARVVAPFALHSRVLRMIKAGMRQEAFEQPD